MKTRLHILLVITLLILCTACGTANTADTTPDTPPDNTGDDMRDLFSPYTIDIPSQPDETVKRANADSARAYAAFMQAYGTTAFDLHNGKIVTFQPDVKASAGDNDFESFAVVDFGLDGRLEIVALYKNRSLGNAIIFCENGTIYIEYTSYDEMLNLKYNGLCYSRGHQNDGSYNLLTFSAESGKRSRTLASHGVDAHTGEEVYYIHTVFQNGEYNDYEKTQVSKEVFDAYIRGITDLPNVQLVHYSTEKVREALGCTDTDDIVPGMTSPKSARAGVYTFDEQTMDANKGILWLYYDFLHNNRKAYHFGEGKEVTFDELLLCGKGGQPADLSLMVYGFADYSANGVLELVMQDWNKKLPYYIILFYDSGKLYIDTVTYRGMYSNALGYRCSGGGSTYHYYAMTFYSDIGVRTTKMAMLQQSPYPDGGYNYEVYNYFFNGIPTRRSTPTVSEAQFDEYMAKYYVSANISWNNLEPVAKGEVSAEEFSGFIANPEVVRSQAYDTRVAADEMVMPNGVKLDITYEEFVAYSGYTGEKPNIYYQNVDSGTIASFWVYADGIQYKFYKDTTKSNVFTLDSIIIDKVDRDVDIFRNIKIGDSMESVFSKIPAMDTELKEWKEQYLYGYEKTDPRGYAQLSFILNERQSNYQIEFYTPDWVVTVYFSRYALTVEEITVQSTLYN